MASTGRLAAVCLTCWVVGLAVTPAMAIGEPSREEMAASWSLGRGLVPGWPDDGEERQAEREVMLDSPEAVRLRDESNTKFEGLDPEQAVKVAGEAFPALVNEAAGGPPKLPMGETISGFLADDAAQVDLPEGKHGVIESMGPMAIETSPGRRTPINLGLHDVGNAFEPQTAAVGVRIPKQLKEGVRLSSSGVSLTPVTEDGSPSTNSEGKLAGAAVFYADSQTDTSTLAKPTTGGFEIDSLLLSVNSPEALYFKVGMPTDATILSNSGVRGGVSVVLDGHIIATIMSPDAHDAAGTIVPVQMSVVGDTLILSVAHSPGKYRYPIAVDPQAYDETIQRPSLCNNYDGEKTNWEFASSGGRFECYSTGAPAGYGIVMTTDGGVAEGEHDELRYAAHGESSVGYIEEESSVGASGASGAITKIEFAHEATREQELTLAGAGQSYSKVKTTFGDLWNESEDHYEGYNNENLVRIMQTANSSAPEADGFWLELNNGTWVGINQKTGPSVSFDTSESTIGEASGRQNVLYGSGHWLGEYNGAVAVTATDPGLGVSRVKIEDLTAGPHGEHWTFVDPIHEEHLCTGVWCAPTYKTYFTYNKEMGEGANTFELCAEDEASMSACTDATVNVDDTSPYGIKITSGLAEEGVEFNATQHQVTVEASDGLSGIRAIPVTIDGKEVAPSSGGSCAGKCTAKETFTIEGESLGAGEHKLIVSADDYAENEVQSEYTFAIRNATPVRLGPGTVDPVTGQFALAASDVDIAGAGSVSRIYDSRSTNATLESPLGPQWSLSSGAGEKLNILPDGSAEVTGAGGEPTIFEKDGKRFTAPKGDENLTLESKEKEVGKGITEYLLKDAAAGTTIVFGRPFEPEYVLPRYVGSTSSDAPEYQRVSHIAVDSKGDVWGSADGNIDEFNSNREFVMAFGYGVSDGKDELQTCTTSCKSGLQGGQKGEPSFTEALAVDANGNIWAVDGDNWIDEYNEHGSLVDQFAEPQRAPSSGSGEVWKAKGIAVGANGDVWVADTGNDRVDEFNANHQFVAAFGWGVLDGGAKFEVCTTVCRRGLSGSGAGEFSEPEGIAIHNGFVWVADTHNDRVEKFTEQYEYVGAFGAAGSGNGEFEYPRHIAADNKGDLWVADGENGRIEEFSEGGGYLGQFGKTGTESELLHWYNFWLGGGGVAVDSSGNVWVAAGGIKEWAHHSTWHATRTEDTAPGDTRTTSYRSIMIEGQPITEPIEELGPVPAGVTCGNNPAEVKQAELSARLAELRPGCRAVSFTYAEKTKTEIGEKPGQWGEYNGRLMKVSFTSYNPAKGVEKMETKVVAEYAYDKIGRLRAEWNPEVESSTACGKTCSALRTMYGYDSEGHVSALTPAGQQPWAFTYGTVSGDASTGRLLKVTRAQPRTGASEEEIKATLGEEEEAPESTEEPKISGSPVVGVRMAVSRGAWSHHPIVYAYQWEREKAGTSEFEPILGATNANYTPVGGDIGSSLRARVSALTGGGEVMQLTARTGQVHESTTERTEGALHSPEPGATIEYHVPLSGSGAPHEMTVGEMAKWAQTNDVPVEATAIFPPDEPQGWPASDYKRASIGYMDAQAREVDAAAPGGGITTTEYNSLNEVTRTLSADNRATALKESCDLAGECKSAEVAEKLSSRKVYNGETQAETEREETEGKHEDGVRLLETYGPEHEVRLPDGTEEETRDREKFSYNEGAPWEETHNVLTKKVQWAESSGEEVPGSKHEEAIFYSGQNSLGWKLRKPTLVTSTAEGHTTTGVTTYEKETGKALSTSSSTTTTAPAFSLRFGAAGSADGQFKAPAGVAMAADGNVLVTDAGNSRVEVFSHAGQFITSYGTAGSGGTAGSAPEFDDPTGIAVNEGTGNIYVADSGNNRVQELSSEGKFVATFGFGVGNGKAEFEKCTSGCQAGLAVQAGGGFNNPIGVTVDVSGDIWVVDHNNNRVEKFSAANNYTAEYGRVQGIQLDEPTYAAASDGNVYVADYGEHRIEEISESGAYVGQFGESGTGNGQFGNPDGIAANPDTGTIFVGDPGNSRVEEFSATGVYITQFGAAGSGAGGLKEPAGIAVDGLGQIFAIDSGNSRVEAWESIQQAPVYTAQLGSEGTEAGQLGAADADAIDAHGDVWVTEYDNDRLSEFSSAGTFIKTVGWGVVNGKKEWESCTSKCKRGLVGSGEGEFDGPTDIVIKEGVLYVADYGNNRIEELNEEGKYLTQFGQKGKEAEAFSGPTAVAIDPSGNIWVAEYLNHRIDEFTAAGKFIKMIGWDVNTGGSAKLETCTSECKAGTTGSGAGQIAWPKLMTFSGSNLYLAEYTNSRVQEYVKGETGEVEEIGSKGTGSGEFEKAAGIAVNAAGDLYVADYGDNRIEEFTPAGRYLGQFGDKGSGAGQLIDPEGIAINSAGDLYVVDEGSGRVEEWTPAPNPGNEGAKDSKTIYYTATANAEDPSCGSHPEWATLPCQTEPDEQPGDSGPPPLPVTTSTYNVWDEPETITERIGSVTRITTKRYDSAGRETGEEKTATEAEGKEDQEDAPVPAVTEEYSTETGALVKLASTIEGKARTITSVFNTLGDLVSYTDAEGSTTKYAYDVDGRMDEISEPKGTQMYSYDSTTGLLTKLVDSAAGTFTAAYDAEGKMVTEGYPNGMTAKYTYNAVGQATNLEYEKTTHCSEQCSWFSDSEAFGPNGELASQTSSLSSEKYDYNESGQLTQTQETPLGGEGCITRLYSYNEASGERESATTREPNENGECASEGGVVEGHDYDTVGRLLDPGVTYDALGNMTTTPALDAGGMAITSSFYVDNQVATQEQNAKSIAYTYDPAGRTMITNMKTTSGTSTKISHYAGPGNALTWTCEEAGECKEASESKWTRNIPGIDGALDAIETSGGTAVLQLHDLQGNIIGTAADNETETKLLTTHNNTEFGVPIGTAPKYSWLGAEGAESELGTGVITEAGATYVPQLARTLQTEVVPAGAAPNGVMATEAYCPPELGWANQSGDEGAANTVAEQRALEAEALELVTGTASDPWGLITGEEARELAAEFNGWADDVENYLKEAENCDAECGEAAEADIKSDRWIAGGLEECYRQTHDPFYRRYHGKTYVQTRVCLVHLNYNTNYDNWIFAKPDSNIWICSSLPYDGDAPSPWGDHGSQEWLCEVEGKEQWWVFGNNRGWWRKVL